MSISNSILRFASAYRLFTYLVGGYAVRKHWIKDNVRPWDGARVLDIGCGPADILNYFNNIYYVGIDSNESYIRVARKKWGNRGIFIEHSIQENHASEFKDFDLVIAFGVLHHLSDEECLHLMEIALHAMKVGGRLITFDGCFKDGQSLIARLLLGADRGKYVRYKHGYIALDEKKFTNVTVQEISGLLRVPYNALIIECQRDF